MLNRAIIMGRLAADPELRYTPNNVPVVAFTLAVGRTYVKQGTDRQTDWIDVVAWRQTAEFVSRYFKKGNPILVCGQLQTRSWTDNQGQKRYATEVSADEVSFVTAAAGANGAPAQGNTYTPDAYATPSFNSASGASFEEIPGDDSLPF